jgi:hypothetical protein
MQKHTSFFSLAVLLSVATFSTPSLALASKDVADQADNKADVVSVDKDAVPASKDMTVQDTNGVTNEAAAPAATQSDATSSEANSVSTEGIGTADHETMMSQTQNDPMPDQKDSAKNS